MNRFARTSGNATLATEERLRTIVLWGAADSGKSGLLGALRSESVKTVGDRWMLDLSDAPPDIVAFADSASLALRLRDVRETPVRRPERAFTIAVRRYAGRSMNGAAALTVLDPRGEVAAEPTSPAARRTIAAVRTADAILWLLEVPPPGAARDAARLAILRQLVAMLEAASTTQLAIPVVVALSKIDRLTAPEMRRLLEAPEEALRGIFGDSAFGWLLAAFPRLRCFAFSAAGNVRNVARPIGLTNILDCFTDEWRREAHAADAARTRARRSERVARVRRRAPLVASVAAAVAIVSFAGIATARLLAQRATWNSSAGSVAIQSAPLPARATTLDSLPADTAPLPSVASAEAALERGDAIGAMRELSRLHVADSSAQRFAADSILASAAMRGVEQTMTAAHPSIDVLLSIVSATTAAIDRAHPGTSVLAPLSLARAGACLGGRLDCPADQVREDLAWALLLGTPAEQDQARRLRDALVGDSVRMP